MTVAHFPTTAAFLAECEQVREAAARRYAVIDTPSRIASRRREAAAAAYLPGEPR